MNIIVVGLSHKTAPVEIREKVAFAPTAMEKPLRQMLALPTVTEGVIVSTCNRVELYATSRDTDAAAAQLKRFLADYHALSLEELSAHLYELSGADAIRHVFRVASSLDSMVIGEPQILGQIKTAYGYACDYKTSGVILNRFLHKAFSVAKRVRTETQIASNAVSVSFAAVELARKIFDSLNDKTVLLIGAGEMCELAARHFVTNGVAQVLVTNRTYERAVKLAKEFNGKPILFENFADNLHRVDIVLTSTGAPNYILHQRQVEEVIKQRRHKPMFFIDIAVPRDIDPKVNDVDNCYLYDVDDLQGVVQSNLKERQREAKKAEAIVEEEIGQFHQWMAGLDVVPTIVALRRRFDEIRQAELAKTFANLKDLDGKERKAIEAMAQAIINKALHQPITVLKNGQNNPAGDNYVEALRALFDLPAAGEAEEAPPEFKNIEQVSGRGPVGKG
ncbi:glutamyl-tRNA reductase [Geoalkalibacter halelectricus]|uniref:Glutamyl-tRNA reductase n=1 Tax=Geoalkalibacter halelectricus TaxID=2847045 RepID=A0ABY5ZH81_9BACT|nr:glutamyl-tRNA reductase [Geoalkalibacter halelectricus]MDO3377884.1 glutamyl-tRNA reductase [Geoalkalibacter halelectricus]UWZ77933.1 glutamyl-tRNA reductase [Geoalkalibacter halelectricus]